MVGLTYFTSVNKLQLGHDCGQIIVGLIYNNDMTQKVAFRLSKSVYQGVFQLEVVKIVLTSHFHKEVRATIGLVPTSQLPGWCYIENERTILERNGLIETPTLRGIIAK